MAAFAEYLAELRAGGATPEDVLAEAVRFVGDLFGEEFCAAGLEPPPVEWMRSAFAIDCGTPTWENVTVWVAGAVVGAMCRSALKQLSRPAGPAGPSAN